MYHTLILAVALTASADVGIPLTGLEAAKGNPYQFVELLTHIGIPAGLELRRADYEKIAAPPPMWLRQFVLSSFEFAKEDTVPLGRVLDAFNTLHANYHAGIVDGVVVVRPVQVRLLYLDEVAPRNIGSGPDIMQIAGSLFLPYAPKANALTRGASSSGPIGVDVDRGLAVRMTIEWKGQTVLDVLNEIVKRASGHSWIVIASNAENPWPEAYGFSHKYFTGGIEQLTP